MTVSKTAVKTTALIIFLAWMMLRGAAPALADSIDFGESNYLQGTVVSYKKGIVIFRTEYVNRIRIPVKSIRSISTDKAVVIKMKDDSILRGKLTTMEAGKVAVIPEPDGEMIPLEWSAIKIINEPPQKWNGDFNLGGDVNSGNTNSTNLNLSLRLEKNWSHDRFSFFLRYEFDTKESKTTENDIYSSIKFDHFFTKKVFGGVSLELLKDEFKDIELQAITGLGPGYQFWNDEVKSLELQIGVAYFSDERIVGPHYKFWSGRLSMVFSYTFLTYFSIENFTLYYPSLETSDKSKIRSETSLISRLGVGWSLRFTYVLDKDSLSSRIPGVEDVDNKFIYSIQYSF